MTAPAQYTRKLTRIDRAYEARGTMGLLLQTLLETGLRVSEFTRLRVEDVSLAERVIVVHGKGSKRREIPIRWELVSQPSFPPPTLVFAVGLLVGLALLRRAGL